MTSSIASLKQRTWIRDNYLITTNPSLISVKDVNAAFATKDMYWATPLPDDAMRAFVENNLCFGVFSIPSSPEDVQTGNEDTFKDALPSNATFIGFGRLMTDFITMAYLTDVFIQPTHQGQGLGRWMLSCIQESLESMPYLRGSMLFTGDWKRSVPLYEEMLGMSVLEGKRIEGGGGEGLASMLKTWKGSPLHEDNGVEIPKDH
ncbi:acetyltransferase [Rhexocercosporidium sp. MPI-PUGE-AT-0058]|nr:acetyltransferase [Rhexocercosporidium sp. MPI-PUGE-AT-0058]